MNNSKRFDAFISYRIDSGAEIARSIQSELLLYNVKSCLNIDLVDESETDDRIYEQIAEIPFFIVTLSPGSLDRCHDSNDRLRREIECAFDNNRVVITIICQDFEFPSENDLPASLARLKTCQSVELSHIDFYAMMGNLVQLMGIPANSAKPGSGSDGTQAFHNSMGNGGKKGMNILARNWKWLVAVLFIAVIIIIALVLNSRITAINWGGENYDRALGLSLDGDENIYVIGSFKHTADLNPGPGMESHTSNGVDDIYITKLDQSGNFLWCRTRGGAEYDEPRAVTCDTDGNVYITGLFNHEVKFNGESERDSYSSNGLRDMFIIKLNQDGDFQWVRAYGGAGEDEPNRIIIDGSGNVVVVGRFSDTVDFGGGLEGFTRTSEGGIDAFLIITDQNGVTQQAITFGSSDDDLFRDIVVDGSGNYYITGNFSDRIDMDPGIGSAILISNGEQDALFCKFDSNLNLVWARSWGGSDTEIADYLTLSRDSEIYVVGTYKSTTDFDPGSGTCTYIFTGYQNVYLSKFDEQGVLLWSIPWTSEDAVVASDVITDTQDYIYLSGSFICDVDFDPGPGEANRYGSRHGDTFLLKLDPDGSFIRVDTWGSSEDDCIHELAIGETGNLYAIGQFYRTIDFDPGLGRAVCSSHGLRDAVLVIYPPGY